MAEQRDPWMHRTSEMKCSTCMWYVEKAVAVSGKWAEGDEPVIETHGSVGRCRRHAPTMNGYPVVFDTDWCGDHKLNENALEAPNG